MVHVVHMYRATWDNWGWSRWIQYPKNPYFYLSHPSVAPISQKLYCGDVAVGVAVGGTRGTRVQGHVRHLGMV